METEQARMDARCCWEAIRLLTVDVAVAHSDLIVTTSVQELYLGHPVSLIGGLELLFHLRQIHEGRKTSKKPCFFFFFC
ncbi:hypothetical protein EJB05_12072 [Eragrostis curvula]|uniref:Uncharacterized protein n=1 Tax=Eragrostis curvula TaxID=38414 RepID=A0A5J9VS72_9POAL|nr:hypothetical protein EJB05_12072 [Eragrostis curvula]